MFLQNVIMEEVVGRELLNINVPPYMHDVKKLKHNQQLIENLRSGLSNHVIGHWFLKLVLAKNIVYTFVSFQSIGSN
jgi:hypothetical protein